jgi:two-component system aerobic respiration control sensor histidine kinase ArcB
VAIEVADAGRGIPADALSRVFEPYYRVPDAAGAAHGTGIGLAVVKALSKLTADQCGRARRRWAHA